MGSEKIRTYHRANSVVFLKTNEQFGGLSNMASGYPLCVNSHYILTAEALYQACRFPHMPEVQRQIIEQRSPMTAKMKSKRYRNNSRSDWYQVRVRIMRWCLRVKLVQNWKKFSHLLLESEDLPIVEQSGKDNFWGAKPLENGSLVGMNVLGRLLMELREEVIRDEKALLLIEPVNIPDFLLDGQEIETVSGEMIVSEKFVTSVHEKQTQLFGNPLARREDTVQEGLGRWEGRGNFSGQKYYPAMKDSDVEWLGDVPEHWEVARLGNLLRERGEINADGKIQEVLSVLRDRGVIPYAEKGNIGNKKSDDITRYKIVRPDDIVVNCMNIIIGSVGISRYTGCLSPVYYVLIKRSKNDDPRYLSAYFETKPFQKSLVRIGNGILAHRMRIPMELLKCELFPRPPLSEQTAIVRYLDYVEQRVRRLVRAKQKLIELLKEQKQTIIHHAVTHGLNPNVPLKDSGVEWLGEVPEHWKVVCLGMATHSIQTGPFGSQLHADEYITGGTPIINPSHMKDGCIKNDPEISVSLEKCQELARHKLCTGDIVAARRGELGRCALVTDSESGWLCGTGSLRIRPKSQIFESSYLLVLLSSQGVRDTLSLSSIGATMDNLNTAMVSRLHLPHPPLDEQVRIMESIADQSNTIACAADAARREIELLQEYRTRLIADVVTGKVDVRAVANRLPSRSDDAESLADGIISDHETSE